MDSNPAANHKTRKDWAYIFSPCIVALILFAGTFIYLFVTISDKEQQAYMILSFIYLMIAAFVALLIDMLFRFVLFTKVIRN